MKIISTLFLYVLTHGLLMSQAFDTLGNHESRREDYALNLSSKADAYSWLSKDGLRIYFSRDNSEGEVWKAERKNLNEDFKNPVSISIDGLKDNSDIFSSWLTEDENTLYFVTQKNNGDYTNSIYKATYDESSKSFNNPVKLNFTGGTSDGISNIFISGPSLTHDLRQMYVYYSDHTGTDRIASFISKDSLNYKFKGFVTEALNYCPGVIADHGLSFYLTLRNENKTLVKLSRKDLNSEFSNPEYFTIGSEKKDDSKDLAIKNDALDKIKISYYQPSVNTELGIFSVTCGSGTWNSNDLEILPLPNQDQLQARTIESDSFQAFEILDTFINATSNTIGYFHLTERIDSANNNEKYWIAVEYSMDTMNKSDSPVVVETELGQTSFSKNYCNILTELFPNPAQNYIQIKYVLPANASEKSYFELMDLCGKVLKSIELINESEIQSIEISDIEEGVYIYYVRSARYASQGKKLIIKG